MQLTFQVVLKKWVHLKKRLVENLSEPETPTIEIFNINGTKGEGMGYFSKNYGVHDGVKNSSGTPV